MALTVSQEKWVSDKIAIENLEKEKEGLIKIANEQKTVKSDEIAAIDVKLIADLKVKDDAIIVLKEGNEVIKK